MGIVRREGSIDFASGSPRIKQPRNRVVGEPYGIVLAVKKALGLERARSDDDTRSRPDECENHRHADPRCKHRLYHRLPMSSGK